MNLKLVIAVAVLAATPAFAQGQMGGPNAPAAPKPTVAQVKAVIDKVAADPAKVKAYCDLNKLQEQMAQVDQKDQKKMKAIGDQLDKLMQQLGPDFGKMMDGLDSVDENSAEGKQYSALFTGLDAKCK